MLSQIEQDIKRSLLKQSAEKEQWAKEHKFHIFNMLTKRCKFCSLTFEQVKASTESTKLNYKGTILQGYLGCTGKKK